MNSRENSRKHNHKEPKSNSKKAELNNSPEQVDSNSEATVSPVTLRSSSKTLSRTNSITGKVASGVSSPRESGSGKNSPKDSGSRKNSVAKPIRISGKDLNCIRNLANSTDRLDIALQSRVGTHHVVMTENSYSVHSEPNKLKRPSIISFFEPPKNSSSENEDEKTPTVTPRRYQVIKQGKNSSLRSSLSSLDEFKNSCEEVEDRAVKDRYEDMTDDEIWSNWDGAHSFEQAYEEVDIQADNEQACKQFKDQCEKFMLFGQYAADYAKDYAVQMKLSAKTVENTINKQITPEIIQNFIRLNK